MPEAVDSFISGTVPAVLLWVLFKWLQQVTDSFVRFAKFENPVRAEQYFDPSTFLSVIKK
jgi:hypothetical protein